MDLLVNSLFEVSIENDKNIECDNNSGQNQSNTTVSASATASASTSASIFKCEIDTCRTDHNVTNMSTTTTRTPGMSLSSVDLKTYLKCVSHLYEIFPEMKYFSLDSSRIQSFLLYLSERRQFSAVRRLALLFPEMFNVHFLQRLVRLTRV